MSEESGDAAEEQRDRGGIDRPGGGPRRVVSEKSVDDILESLNETAPADERSPSAPSVRSADSSSTETDETRVDEDSSGGNADADGADLEGGDPASEVDDGDSSTDEPAESARRESDETARSDEGLAARIETGSVTGADVRAAETGEGREATPEVDEIDLSLADLEASSSDSISSDGAADGAGSAERDGEGATSGTLEEDESNEDDGGLFGRLKRLFSR